MRDDTLLAEDTFYHQGSRSEETLTKTEKGKDTRPDGILIEAWKC